MSVQPEQYAALKPEQINPKIRDMEYAVRGQIVLNAQAHMKALKNGETRPFPEVVLCNIGNPQSVGQKPMTFARQVLSLCTCPSMLENKAITDALPEDVVARAKRILGNCNGLGAYSESKGIEVVRESVKNYIAARDGYPAVVDDIFLTNGASEGVKTILNMMVRGPKDGVMIPIPQYPLYSATCTALGGAQVKYYLNEEGGWSLTKEALDKAAADAKAKGVELRCLCVINPGNPTGQVMTEENIKTVIEWAGNHGVLIMADEVYQANVYDPKLKFHSFKKVLRSMPEYADKVELVSYHSTSKGVVGECGLRGGYMELCNIHPTTKDQVYKTLSVNLCSNLTGQVMTELMVNEPKPGDASYDLYKKEYDNIFESLKRRALKLVKGLNDLEGVTCNPASGAMYAFPNLRLPQKWVDECQKKGVPADTQYCLDLLDATGICVVPGSGFGQVEGTWHFRTTFLPQEDKMESVNERLSKFHAKFMSQYK
jgi:alanine transaminase